MALRRFSLPLASLNLTLTAGCTPELAGDWTLTEVSVWGKARTVGEAPSYTDPFTYEGSLHVDDELGVSFEKETLAHEYNASLYIYSGQATTKKGVTTLALATDRGWELDLDCTLDDDALDCEGEVDRSSTDDFPVDWGFGFERDSS